MITSSKNKKKSFERSNPGLLVFLIMQSRFSLVSSKTFWNQFNNSRQELKGVYKTNTKCFCHFA